MANKCVIKKKETKYMARIPQAEISLAMQELSATAFKLLMYYYSKNDGWVFIDKNIAKAIGSSERMVKEYRKELIKHKYLLIQKGQVDVYFVGKGAVEQFEQNDYTELEESIMDPIIGGKA